MVHGRNQPHHGVMVGSNEASPKIGRRRRRRPREESDESFRSSRHARLVWRMLALRDAFRRCTVTIALADDLWRMTTYGVIMREFSLRRGSISDRDLSRVFTRRREYATLAFLHFLCIHFITPYFKCIQCGQWHIWSIDDIVYILNIGLIVLSL